jgi:hypothetical protein
MGFRIQAEGYPMTYVSGGFRNEFMCQLLGVPREARRQLTDFGREAVHQLDSGWGEEVARQIFGTPRHRHQGR